MQLDFTKLNFSVECQFFTQILFRKVKLRIASLILLMKKEHKYFFVIKYSV